MPSFDLFIHKKPDKIVGTILAGGGEGGRVVHRCVLYMHLHSLRGIDQLPNFRILQLVGMASWCGCNTQLLFMQSYIAIVQVSG